MITLSQTATARYWAYALRLAFFTVFYNLAEGLISIYFGAQDETLTLFGFGADSFIEVMSGIGILAMVIRSTSLAPGLTTIIFYISYHYMMI